MKKIKSIRLSKFYKILLLITLICIALFVTFTLSTAFSELFTLHASSLFRITLAFISSIFPFSLAEMLLYAFILFALFLIGCGTYSVVQAIRGKKTRLSVFKLLSLSIAIALIVFDLFVLTFASSYHRSSLEANMELTQSFEKQDVIDTLIVIRDKLNALCDKVSFDERGASDFSGSFGELFDKVKKASDALADKHSFLQNTGFSAKPILLSSLMTYTHISGVFAFFTGEANVNTNYPDYVVAFSTAHEYAHARGVGPENEANFIAFLTTAESGDPYLEYCGYAYVFSTVAKAVMSIDKNAYKEIVSELDDRVFGEYKAYSEFFEKYKDSAAADVSSAVNNAYLQLQGQKDGVKTYGYFTDMIVKYFLKTGVI